jgi:DNA-directed RNA polymerase specialized sigma24 family protein
MTQPTTDAIIRTLPGLRRYACAVTGSTRSGDEYIRVALEALVEEPWRLPPQSAVKPELYALLHRTLKICNFEDSGAAPAVDEAADMRHHLQRLSLVNRELLLLVDLEGFTPCEAAELLGLTEADAEWRLAQARRVLRDSRRRSRRSKLQ